MNPIWEIVWDDDGNRHYELLRDDVSELEEPDGWWDAPHKDGPDWREWVAIQAERDELRETEGR